MSKILVIAFLISTFIFVNSCDRYCLNHPGRKGYEEIIEIPSSDKEKQLRKFSSYPVETQIDIYLFGELCVEGNPLPLEKFLAYEGEEKVTIIAERLDKERHWQKALLIKVLAIINGKCKCVSNNPYVMEILLRNSPEMTEWPESSSRQGKRYLEYLDDIKKNKPQPPLYYYDHDS